MRWVYIVGFGASIGAAAARAVQADGIGTAVCLTAAALNLAALRLDQQDRP